MAVMAVMPCTPAAANALRSAWMPAPPPESEPAIERTRGVAAISSRMPRRAALIRGDAAAPAEPCGLQGAPQDPAASGSKSGGRPNSTGIGPALHRGQNSLLVVIEGDRLRS